MKTTTSAYVLSPPLTRSHTYTFIAQSSRPLTRVVSLIHPALSYSYLLAHTHSHSPCPLQGSGLSHTLSPSLSHTLVIPPQAISLTHTYSLSHMISLSPSLAIPLNMFPAPSHSFSQTHHDCLTHSLPLSLVVSLVHSLYSFSLTLTHCLSLTRCLSHSLTLVLPLMRWHSLSLTRCCLSHSLCPSLTAVLTPCVVFVSHSLSRSPPHARWLSLPLPPSHS